jgi:hypothetical protein
VSGLRPPASDPARPARWWTAELPRRTRVWLSLAIGCVAAVLVWTQDVNAKAVGDWDQCWIAGRALLQGKSSYTAVNAESSPWPLIYPLPAVLVSLPFTPLPLPLARAAFTAVTSALLAYGLSTRWLGLLPFASGAYFWALMGVQWVPLLVAAVLLPWLSALLVVKPTTGLVLWAGWPSRVAVIGGIVLLAMSFAVDPWWVGKWRTSVGAGIVYHVPLVMRPFGWVLLLAALRWRRPEGRFLTAFALMPQAAMPYDALPLLLIPKTFLERVIFVAGTQLLALIGMAKLGAASPGAFADSLWPATLLLAYLPALIMVLRPKVAPTESVQEQTAL